MVNVDGKGGRGKTRVTAAVWQQISFFPLSDFFYQLHQGHWSMYRIDNDLLETVLIFFKSIVMVKSPLFIDLDSN